MACEETMRLILLLSTVALCFAKPTIFEHEGGLELDPRKDLLSAHPLEKEGDLLIDGEDLLIEEATVDTNNKDQSLPQDESMEEFMTVIKPRAEEIFYIARETLDEVIEEAFEKSQKDHERKDEKDAPQAEEINDEKIEADDKEPKDDGKDELASEIFLWDETDATSGRPPSDVQSDEADEASVRPSSDVQSDEVDDALARHPSDMQSNEVDDASARPSSDMQSDKVDDASARPPSDMKSDEVGDASARAPSDMQSDEVDDASARPPSDMKSDEVDDASAKPPSDMQSDEADDASVIPPSDVQSDEVDDASARPPSDVQSDEVDDASARPPSDMQSNEVDDASARPPSDVQSDEADDASARPPSDVQSDEVDDASARPSSARTPSNVKSEEVNAVEETTLVEADLPRSSSVSGELQDLMDDDFGLSSSEINDFRDSIAEAVEKALKEAHHRRISHNLHIKGEAARKCGKEEVPKGKGCCKKFDENGKVIEETMFDRETQTCSRDGKVVSRFICSEVAFDPEAKGCCRRAGEEILFDKTTERCSKRHGLVDVNQEECGFGLYNKRSKRCCGDMIYSRSADLICKNGRLMRPERAGE